MDNTSPPPQQMAVVQLDGQAVLDEMTNIKNAIEQRCLMLALQLDQEKKKNFALQAQLAELTLKLPEEEKKEPM